MEIRTFFCRNFYLLSNFIKLGGILVFIKQKANGRKSFSHTSCDSCNLLYSLCNVVFYISAQVYDNNQKIPNSNMGASHSHRASLNHYKKIIYSILFFGMGVAILLIIDWLSSLYRLELGFLFSFLSQPLTNLANYLLAFTKISFPDSIQYVNPSPYNRQLCER